MSFLPLKDPVDFVTFAGQRTPGVAEITGLEKVFVWDERKGGGRSGSYPAYKRIDLATFTVTLRITEDDHWDAWHKLYPALSREPSGKNARAFDVWHPILEDHKITSVVIEKISQPMAMGDGEFQIEIRCKEFRPPKPSVAVVKSADTKKTSEVEQLSKQDLELMKRVEYAEELRAENAAL